MTERGMDACAAGEGRGGPPVMPLPFPCPAKLRRGDQGRPRRYKSVSSSGQLQLRAMAHNTVTRECELRLIGAC